MLSDEEKKAIDSFKEVNNNDLSRFDDFNSYTQFKVKRDKIIIDLIEKQSKEIEELNYIKRSFDYCVEQENKKWEDKIKEKIEEFKIIRDTILENEKELNRPMMTYDLKRNDYCEKMLQSLLEKEV